MARTTLSGLRESLYTTEEITEMDVAAEGASTAMDLAVGTEEEDWTFSENTENADSSSTDRFDLQDGITANWGTQTPKNVRVVASVIIDEGANIGTDPGDTFDVMVAHNEVVVFGSEEGLGDPDEGAVTYNVDGVVLGVKGGDTLRFVVKGAEGNIAADLDIDVGEFDVMQA